MMEINDGEKLLTLLYFVVGRGLITVASAPMALPIVGHNYIPVDNVQSYAKRHAPVRTTRTPFAMVWHVQRDDPTMGRHVIRKYA